MSDQAETEVLEPVVPEKDRPKLSGDPEGEDDAPATPANGSVASSGETSDPPKRGPGRPPGSRNRPRGAAATAKRNERANARAEKAAAGAAILYGGTGVLLAGVGLAPAAGVTMQALSDEAGVDIAAWARKRSPRFYGFLVSLSDATGIGKYVAAPAAAEVYCRAPQLRPALAPTLSPMLGAEGAASVDHLAVQYDSMRAAQPPADVPDVEDAPPGGWPIPNGEVAEDVE